MTSSAPLPSEAPAPVVVLAGASGFIGTYLAARFREIGYAVRRIGRTGPDARWDDPASIAAALDGATLLVNLAGRSVNCRYTDANRAEIFASRVDTTRALRLAILGLEHPPRLWLNASTATIYRHADDRPQTERSGEIGEGFSVDVATAWEREFLAGELPGTRRIALRMSIVLGDGPATRMLRTLARAGLGGPQYDGPWVPSASRRLAGTWHEPRETRGGQRFSWVHIEDVWRIVRFLEEHEELSGPINIASPEPSDNRTLMKLLRWSSGLSVGLPAARWMLEPAMFVLRTETELVLKSRWVVPETLLDAGYVFVHPELSEAIESWDGR